jgi:hypothetical protein
MRTYKVFLTSAALTIAAVVAAIVLQGGWEAAAAGAGIAAGLAWLVSLMALLAAGERPRPRGPRARPA